MTPYLQPREPVAGRLIQNRDGSCTMTLLPGDGKRIEWTWGNDADRPPLGRKFQRTINAGVIANDVQAGHEWCLWQLHTPDSDPNLSSANPAASQGRLTQPAP